MTRFRFLPSPSIAILLIVLAFVPFAPLHSQSDKKPLVITAKSNKPDYVSVTLRSVDVSRFPEVSVILDARDTSGNTIPKLQKTDLSIYQDGRKVQISGIEKVSASNNIPVDIIFVIDQTGSMRQEVNEVKTNIAEFTQRLSIKGVDYRLGLVTFSDKVEKSKGFTEDVNRFISWIDEMSIGGGGDDNENALEGLYEAGNYLYRLAAQRIVILITDAMYHQKGDRGDGVTQFNTATMARFLQEKNMRLFAITPPTMPEYQVLVNESKGKRFDIVDDFSSILDEFSESLTNLYAIRYTMTEEVPPEDIQLEVRNAKEEVILSETVPIIEVDKKFIFENILFEFNQATFQDDFNKDLQYLFAIMNAYPTVHVEVRGHTDFIGSDEYNVILSDARARAVKKYLVDRGVDPQRITTRGMGKAYPIAPNDTEEGRRLNRRTEVIITRK